VADSTESPDNAHIVGHHGAQVHIHQRPARAVNGWFGVLVLIASIAGIILAANDKPGMLWLPIAIFVVVITSLVIVAPGQSSVSQFFGHYIGTISRQGFWWVAPRSVRRGVSLRVRNFETARLKVNDADGSPVDIAAIVVWQVADTAIATYAVDDYHDFVGVQAESALRLVATSYPYDDTTGTLYT
jgi:regulator of protease activity HflC (stomatin/prohibitin superfamily)